MTPLFTLPSASTTYSSMADYSGNTFTAFLPVVYLACGILIGALVVSALIGWILRGAHAIVGNGKGRRGRGRRR